VPANQKTGLRPLADWSLVERRAIVGVFTDIDDTLTTHGAITPDALQALADLKAAGLQVIAITGRPVGWGQPFASSWPVDALVAENGAVALVPEVVSDQTGLQPSPTGRRPLSKRYQQDAATRERHWDAMQRVADDVLRAVPSARLARDEGGRETDLAFDYAEFNQQPPEDVQRVLDLLAQAGMHTSISSIHIHGCFDDFNKWLGARWIVRELLGRDLQAEADRWVFVGDSGNDQVMFEHLPTTVGVANVRRFVKRLSHLPRYVAPSERGAGFAEVAQALLAARR
jgi:HAD superfamily hydrolase (TIGR01484 family)